MTTTDQQDCSLRPLSGDDDDEEQDKDEGNEGEEPEKQTPGTLPKTKAIAKTKGTRKACIVFIHKTIQITSK